MIDFQDEEVRVALHEHAHFKSLALRLFLSHPRWIVTVLNHWRLKSNIRDIQRISPTLSEAHLVNNIYELLVCLSFRICRRYFNIGIAQSLFGVRQILYTHYAQIDSSTNEGFVEIRAL